MKNYPTDYIHSPWKAPYHIQSQAKCIIGVDYSYPMVDHAEVSRQNLERMKQVYQQLSRYRGPGNVNIISNKLLIKLHVESLT